MWQISFPIGRKTWKCGLVYHHSSNECQKYVKRNCHAQRLKFEATGRMKGSSCRSDLPSALDPSNHWDPLGADDRVQREVKVDDMPWEPNSELSCRVIQHVTTRNHETVTNKSQEYQRLKMDTLDQKSRRFKLKCKTSSNTHAETLSEMLISLLLKSLDLANRLKQRPETEKIGPSKSNQIHLLLIHSKQNM